MTQPLPAPTIAQPSPNSTQSNPVQFKGQGTPGATISLKVNGVSTTTVVAADGNWLISLQLDQGPNTAAAFQQLNGEISLPTSEIRFTVN